MVYVQRQADFRTPLQKSMQTVDYLITLNALRNDKLVSLAGNNNSRQRIVDHARRSRRSLDRPVLLRA